MPFQISPGVNFSEIDLTTTVPAVATTEGAIAGVFRWGPENERVLVSSEVELVTRFGKPFANTTWSNAETFFTAANFLGYSDALYVTRVTESANTANGTVFDAKYAGALGNSLQVGYCDSTSFAATSSTNTLTINASSTSGTINSSANTVDVEVGDTIIADSQELSITALGSTSGDANSGYTTAVTFDKKYVAASNLTTGAYSHQWGFASQFDSAPDTSSVHMIVIDEDGEFSGVAGTVLEKFENVSLTAGAKTYDGSTNYIVDVLEQGSSFIAIDGNTVSGNGYDSMTGGTDGSSESAISVGELATGYDLYRSPEDVDVSFILQGRPQTHVLANYIIDNIAEFRRDCVAFISPESTDTTAQNIVDFAANVSSSSYAVLDSGYKYQYDKYSDVYRWVPLNGDIAGLCARTDDLRDPWFSPAGYARGSVKNVVKLRLNPNKVDRDLLYRNGINPVITQPGQGTILYGDKTFLNQPSAFSHINVRRLFIVLEKSISIAAKRSLFEFNDEFTRAQFRNLVEPYLRDVQGRRGIFDFRVVCDESNNTGDVIDRAEFVGDIYIKPSRSINFIQLNFVAVRSGVEFSEIVG